MCGEGRETERSGSAGASPGAAPAQGGGGSGARAVAVRFFREPARVRNGAACGLLASEFRDAGVCQEKLYHWWPPLSGMVPLFHVCINRTRPRDDRPMNGAFRADERPRRESRPMRPVSPRARAK